jgi:outer dense fiber protein 2
MQTRILDLESQLSQTRAEIARVKREKEEVGSISSYCIDQHISNDADLFQAERKFNSRLYDLKDRLDQSHSTNRSMQNYVQFLKNSYANVFSDSVITPNSPLRGSGFP